MNEDIQLKGRLKVYMQWPIIMAFLLVALNAWVLVIDRKAAAVMLVFVIIYILGSTFLYIYCKSSLMLELVAFAAQYGIVQNTLLKELEVPSMYCWSRMVGVKPSKEVRAPLLAPNLPVDDFHEVSSNPFSVHAVKVDCPAAGSVLLSRYFQMVFSLITVEEVWEDLSSACTMIGPASGGITAVVHPAPSKTARAVTLIFVVRFFFFMLSLLMLQYIC